MTTGRINQVTMLSERRNAAVHAGTHAQLDYALDGDLGSCTQPWKGSRYTSYRPPQNVVAFEFQNHTFCKHYVAETIASVGDVLVSFHLMRASGFCSLISKYPGTITITNTSRPAWTVSANCLHWIDLCVQKLQGIIHASLSCFHKLDLQSLPRPCCTNCWILSLRIA